MQEFAAGMTTFIHRPIIVWHLLLFHPHSHGNPDISVTMVKLFCSFQSGSGYPGEGSTIIQSALFEEDDASSVSECDSAGPQHSTSSTPGSTSSTCKQQQEETKEKQQLTHNQRRQNEGRRRR